MYDMNVKYINSVPGMIYFMYGYCMPSFIGGGGGGGVARRGEARDTDIYSCNNPTRGMTQFAWRT